MLKNICILSEANYSNYVRRIKEYNIKRFLELDLNIPFYISTNLPNEFQEYENNPLIKVFDIEKLRENNINSKENEKLPENPVGLYPAKYPWNLRRFILRKAIEDGYTGLLFIECDTKINQNITKDEFFKQIEGIYENNTVKTSSARFVYKHRYPTQELFGFHQNYINDLNLNFGEDDYDTLDGTNQLFFGEDQKSLLNFINNWDFICDYGYRIKNGYKNGYLSNLSFVIPLSRYKLVHCDTPFTTEHVFEDRYTYDFKFKKDSSFNENILLTEEQRNKTEDKNKNDIDYFFNYYHTKKFYNGFSQIFKNFFKKIKNTNPSVLEIGVGTVSLEPPEGRNHVPENMFSWKEQNPNYQPGNSLRAMRDYFVNCELYGIDIQKDCMLSEPNITTSIFDSRNPKKSQEFINNKRFDLIIDDSDKDVNIRILTFKNFYSSLKENGYYVIEGLLESQFLCEYLNHYGVSYKIIGDFMIISKNNNFSVFDNAKETHTNLENPHYTEIKEDIDYEKLINTTPKFSILNYKLADKGFYINLKKSVERKDNVEKQIEEFDIKGLIRFGALTDEMIQYSCTKSHLSVFRNALENNLETIFVAEDDFQINEGLYLPNYNPIYFSDKIGKIKNDLDSLEWDVFLFGCNPKSHIVPITENVGLINKSTGAWAYLIKRRAYEYLLNNLNYKRDYIAIDDYLPMLSDVGFRTLTAIPLTIGHAVGYVSTLQPKGPVNYTDWIIGNYHRFLFDNYPKNSFVDDKIEKNLTICIPGFYCENYMFYLRYALKSLPDELRRCKFLIRFDTPTKDYDNSNFIKLQAYFRDVKCDLNVTLTQGFGGLISSFEYFMKNVKTEYFMMYEFDYVFLKKNTINFKKILEAFKNHKFINTVYFSGDDISVRGFDLCTDKNGNNTPFELENRVSEVNLVTTARWSNRPAIHRLSKMQEWFEKYMRNEHIGIIHQSCYNVEDAMIPAYQRTINENSWEDIKDDWGTYLYGNFGEGPFIGHTDSSKRYQNEIKSILEINADKYVSENPLSKND